MRGNAHFLILDMLFQKGIIIINVPAKGGQQKRSQTSLRLYSIKPMFYNPLLSLTGFLHLKFTRRMERTFSYGTKETESILADADQVF